MPGHSVVKSITPDRSLPYDKSFDLRSPGWFARWPIIGIIMVGIGLLVLGALTYNLYAQGPLLQWDYKLANTLPALGLKSPPIVKYIINAGFYLGKEVVGVLIFLHAIYFVYKRYWLELSMILIGVMGSSLVFYIISHIIGRPRPSNQIWIIVNIPGFPSGHATSVVAFFGFLAYLMVPRVRSILWKWVIIATMIIIILFVGFSRIFTGGHYLTDILSGYALGMLWAGLIFTLLEIYFRKRGSLHVQKG